MTTKQCACGALMEQHGPYVTCSHCDEGNCPNNCRKCIKYNAGTARKLSQR